MLDFERYIDNSEKLSPEEFYKRFDEYWLNTRSSFRKYEALQYYHDEWLNGFEKEDKTEFISKMQEFKLNEKDDMFNALSSGIKLKRLHKVEFPISKYIEYEFYSYYISNYLGFQIKIADADNSKTGNTRDFVLFDDNKLLIHEYSPEGKLAGAYDLTNDKQRIIKEIANWFDEVYSESSDFRDTFRPDAELLKQIL